MKSHIGQYGFPNLSDIGMGEKIKREEVSNKMIYAANLKAGNKIQFKAILSFDKMLE